MKSYEDCLTEANVPVFPKRTTPTHNWYFYSNGAVAKIVPANNFTEIDALMKQYPAREKVAVIDVEYAAAVEAYHDAQSVANHIWNEALREEFSYLSDAVYSICFDEAYDRSHSGGYDEVASTMIRIVDFAERIIDVCK